MPAFLFVRQKLIVTTDMPKGPFKVFRSYIASLSKIPAIELRQLQGI